MPLALYMGVHIPRAITNGLRRRGVDVLTAQEDGTAELDDPPLLDRATELNRPLYTQDDDLLAEARRRQRTDETFSGVIEFRAEGRHVFESELRPVYGVRAAPHELCRGGAPPSSDARRARGRRDTHVPDYA